MNPTSQLKLILWGYVVAFPDNVPFTGTGNGPQSFAEVKMKLNVFLIWKSLRFPLLFSLVYYY